MTCLICAFNWSTPLITTILEDKIRKGMDGKDIKESCMLVLEILQKQLPRNKFNFPTLWVHIGHGNSLN